MASDPLSDTTHKARTYLLGISAAGFLTSWYNLKIRDMPFSGIDITVDEKLVPVALSVGIGYFLASFVIYGIDDIINLSATPYQERVVAAYERSISRIRENTLRLLHSTLRAHIKPEDIPRLANELWDNIFPILDEEDQETFRDGVQRIAAEDVIGITKKMDAFYESIADDFMSARESFLDVKELAPHILSKRYNLYRTFRVYVFDLCLPPLVALAALVTMWWHLLPL